MVGAVVEAAPKLVPATMPSVLVQPVEGWLLTGDIETRGQDRMDCGPVSMVTQPDVARRGPWGGTLSLSLCLYAD